MIEVEALTRRFGEAVAVDNLDLEVSCGEVFGFLGPNGAGKTTTMQMLCGLLRPTSGSIRVLGTDWLQDPDAVRRQFAYAPDTPPLYEYLTVAEHCDFVASLYGVRHVGLADSYLDSLGMRDRRDSLCKSLSHGMRKKAHLAAILAVRPPLLVLDEPSNGLDPQSTRHFKDLMLRLRDEGTTVFMSTHVLDVVEATCDRIGVLQNGRLLACGSVAELRSGASAATLEDLFLQLTAPEQGVPGEA